MRARSRAQLVLEPEHVLDAGEVEPELGRQPLDQPQPLDVGLGVEARAARRARRAGRAPSPRTCAASADACRRARRRRRSCSADGRSRLARSRRLARLLARAPCRSPRAPRARPSCSFFGHGHLHAREQVAACRAPFSFGAPRPLTRSSLPFSVPAGTFSETGPVGGRDLDRRAERGLGVRDRHVERRGRRRGARRAATARRATTTKRSPAGPAAVARPRPCP